MNFTYLFTSFNSRINRKPYWLGILFLAVMSIFLSFGFTLAILNPNGSIGVLAAIGLIGFLAYLASIPLVVKRLHDRNKSGHYAWLIYGSSIIGSVIDSATRNTAEMSASSLIAALIVVGIGLWFFIELGFFRGTPGPNAYGPDPLDAAV
jgi:uncharacterized membrane protein YhaH (DUF805 family)